MEHKAIQITFTLLILTLHISMSVMKSTSGEIDSWNNLFIMVSKSGKIKMTDSYNQPLWESTLDKPLITTKINVKNINFDEVNILPGEDGGLYWIDTKSEQFEWLDIEIQSLVKSTPIKMEKISKGTFFGTKEEKLYSLNLKNGEIINSHINSSDVPGRHQSEINGMYLHLKRIDYFIQMKYNDTVHAWNASVSDIELFTDATCASNVFAFGDTSQPIGSEDNTVSIQDKKSLDYSIYVNNKNENLFIFKYNSITNKVETIKNRKHDGGNNDSSAFDPSRGRNNKEGNNNNDALYRHTTLYRLYYNVTIFLITFVVTLLLIFPYNPFKKDKDKTGRVQPVNNPVTTQVPEVKNKEYHGSVNTKLETSNSENLSQLSTKDKLNRSNEEEIRLSKHYHSLSFNVDHLVFHKESAPESERRHDVYKDINCSNTKRNCSQDSGNRNSTEEELAPHKVYTMKKIEKNRNSKFVEKPKSAPPILNLVNLNQTPSPQILSFSSSRKHSLSDSGFCLNQKAKFKPTDEQWKQLKILSSKYWADTNWSSSDSLCKIEQCSTDSQKYSEIYKIINQCNKDESFMSTNQEIITNQKLEFCDTGRLVLNFDNIQLIGKGGFGSVFKAQHKIDGSWYAIKIIKFQIGLDDNLSQISEVQEIKTMMKVEHKNIVRYITSWFEYEDWNLGKKKNRAWSMDEPNPGVNSNENKMKNRTKSWLKLAGNFPLSRVTSTTNNDFELVFNDDDESKGKENCFSRQKNSHSNTKKNNNNNNNNNINYYSSHNSNIFQEEYSFSDSYSFNNTNNIEDRIIFSNEDIETTGKDQMNPHDNIDIFDIGNKSKKSNTSVHNLNPKEHQIKITYPVYFYMQMEYCEGCPLNYYLQKRTEHSPRNLIAGIFLQICKAVHHIHSKSIIHRDLKPANIFIHGHFKVKIGDFGWAAEKSWNSPTKDNVGTFIYQSPEQWEGRVYNEKVDVYATGWIWLEMCEFFKTESERKITLMNIRKGIYPVEDMKGFENELKLIQKMTVANPAQRPSIDDVINSEEMKELIECCL